MFPIACAYYSPGDRAQTVIPGGAKKNESLWKSRNNVGKPILRFPTFLFSIALVIERKKLSPEARKRTRASESLKITWKDHFLCFPIFLFTIAGCVAPKVHDSVRVPPPAWLILWSISFYCDWRMGGCDWRKKSNKRNHKNKITIN